jgi:Kef-type K+ transport system membrane component KefB
VDLYILILGLMVFISSLISLRFGVTVAIVEIIFGIIAGNSGLLTPQPWILYLAGFGGIFLTFLAGAETNITVMREKFKESFLIGIFSFLAPFLGIFLYTYFIAGWSLLASLIAGTALSETAVAVIYSIMVETNLSWTKTGKLLMASTFITNMGTALALSVLFVKPTFYTLVFLIITIVVIILATKFSSAVFENPRLKNKVIEPEIKYIFLLLLIFLFFANLGGEQAILPAFILGLFMSRHFGETSKAIEVKNRLKTVAFALITPIFFIVGGLKVSLPLIASVLVPFIIILAIRQFSKFAGVYFFARKYIPDDNVYITLLMSTGLTFGVIASLFGLNSGYIDQVQYSLLTGVLITSAIIPTVVAQKWFLPSTEDSDKSIEL